MRGIAPITVRLLAGGLLACAALGGFLQASAEAKSCDQPDIWCAGDNGNGNGNGPTSDPPTSTSTDPPTSASRTDPTKRTTRPSGPGIPNSGGGPRPTNPPAVVQPPPAQDVTIVESLTELASEGLPTALPPSPPRSSSSSASVNPAAEIAAQVEAAASVPNQIEVASPTPARVPVRAPGFPIPPDLDDDASVPIGMAIGLAVGGLATGFVVALGVLGKFGTRKV